MIIAQLISYPIGGKFLATILPKRIFQQMEIFPVIYLNMNLFDINSVLIIFNNVFESIHIQAYLFLVKRHVLQQSIEEKKNL
jgi:hypothetical protein